jgi:general secretion pathway protein A
MIEEFYSLNKAPFPLNTDPVYLYLGETHKQVLTNLEYGLVNKAGLLVVFGAMGTGKTMLVSCLLDQIEEKHTAGILANGHNDSFAELLDNVLSAFKLQIAGKSKFQKTKLLQGFLANEFANNRQVLLVIDEAHVLSAEVFKQLRTFCNYNFEDQHLMQIILTGRESLYEKVKQPALQLIDRCTVIFNELKPLSEKETRQYIQHRLEVAGGVKCGQIFTPDACEVVYKHTGGVPGLINMLSVFALEFGCASKQKVIYADTVEQVILMRKEELQLFAEEGILPEGDKQQEIEDLLIEQGDNDQQNSSDAELDRALDFIDLLAEDHDSSMSLKVKDEQSGYDENTAKANFSSTTIEKSFSQSKKPSLVESAVNRGAVNSDFAAVTDELSASPVVQDDDPVIDTSSDAELDKVLDAIDSQPINMEGLVDRVESAAPRDNGAVTREIADKDILEDGADISPPEKQQSLLIENDRSKRFIEKAELDTPAPLETETPVQPDTSADQIEEGRNGLIVLPKEEKHEPVHFLRRLSALAGLMTVKKDNIYLVALIFLVAGGLFLILNDKSLDNGPQTESIAQQLVNEADKNVGKITAYYEAYKDSSRAAILEVFSEIENKLADDVPIVEKLPEQLPATLEQIQSEPGKAMQSPSEWQVAEIEAEDDEFNSSAEQQYLNELLDLAHQQIEMKKLTTPAGDSAWDTYQQILEIAPGNKQALSGIKNIKNIYKRWAKFEIVKGDFAHAEFLYRKILKISPNEKEVLETLAWFDDINNHRSVQQ